ncbi:diacylglycerol/lipid kinase family protein [uncultured Sphingomonas sp.]|uniref:diacylglycerol/lipid kinase family protein n=1 Tax=uncultured Sphingomonas sp. TaxID=158754 RepID=UPI0035C9D9A4
MMHKLWLITNPHSGSSDAQKAEAIVAVCIEAGLEMVGRTDFPDDTLPKPAALDKAGADTVLLFAGDGTINAAVCALAEWDGAILILPGGTMNMLARMLHESLDPAEIVGLAHAAGKRIALPYVEAGPHRALVGLILGPAASWYRAREIVRKGKIKGLFASMRGAWRRTFGHGIRVTGAPGLTHHAQAVLVRADADGLEVAAIDARDFRAIAELGWSWMTGDWVAARSVTEVRATELRIAEKKPVLALFDGEPIDLAPGTTIATGRTGKQFIATRKDAP